ncbi:zinc ribbon domain-containing protein [Oscillibacter valericigenes]|uniref:Zinc ribbon domain-containing protein n=1 Tax=Oscillibacter valericigenes TaxID=351091 RepID=A0ABS2FS27_9FIRM|nr:zinc ribbon domain-containing protein [Oscillibacter valericigenes]
MKHVKPGRGPSAMGAFGAIIAVIFGIFWTVSTASMGAPAFFPIFGVLFIIIGIVQAVYNFKNATGKNRYSSFDIVDNQEEPDPWDQQFGGDADAPVFRDIPPTGAELRYCPYCGAEVGEGFAFCAKCGRKLPDIP